MGNVASAKSTKMEKRHMLYEVGVFDLLVCKVIAYSLSISKRLKKSYGDFSCQEVQGVSVRETVRMYLVRFSGCLQGVV